MEDLKLPNKRENNSDELEIPLPTIKKNEVRVFNGKDFAGEGWLGCKIGQVYQYKLSGQLPSEFKFIFDNAKYNATKTNFKEKCRHYSVSKTCVSELSRSKLLFKAENFEFERVVPYQDEIENILKWVHIDNGTHLDERKSFDRAIQARVFWHGYTKEIKTFIKNCSCSCNKGRKKRIKVDIDFSK